MIKGWIFSWKGNWGVIKSLTHAQMQELNIDLMLDFQDKKRFCKKTEIVLNETI